MFKKNAVLALIVVLALCAHVTFAFRFGGRSYVSSFRGNGHHYGRIQDKVVGLERTATPSTSPLKEGYFEAQVLDHFYGDKKLWSQRYFMNKSHWRGPGYPVFLYVGGEAALSPAAVDDTSFMAYLAKKHGAMMVAVEHRFYGSSWPTKDMSNDNLRYLHAEQALADLVTFYDYFTTKYTGGTSSPWVTFGGSYPGTLAGWFRARFPHLTVGAVASSAPVDTHIDFKGYMTVVENSLRYYGGDACVNAIGDGVAAVASMVETATGRAELTKRMNLCKPLTENILDIATFQSNVIGTFQNTVQYNNIVSKTNTITNMCKVAVSWAEAKKDPLGMIIEIQAKFAPKEIYNPKLKCTEINYAESILVMQNVTFANDKNMRQWTWQTCNEFGMFQTADQTTSVFHPFGKYLNLAYFEQICADAFGVARKPYATFSNSFYGGIKNAGTNIAWVNGNIDPWHWLGILNTTQLIQPSERGVFIDGGAHCSDMYAPKETDTESLQQAHATIAKMVSNWLLQWARFLRRTGGAGTDSHKSNWREL